MALSQEQFTPSNGTPLPGHTFPRAPLWIPTPDAIARTQLTEFICRVEQKTGMHFGSYPEFERFAIAHSPKFWSLLLEWANILYEGDANTAVTDATCENAQFFPHVRLNYAENLLRIDGAQFDPSNPALTAVHADRAAEHINRGELLSRVQSLADKLQGWGLTVGDCVALISHNTATAVVGALAAASVGCTVSTFAPELGSATLISRLQQAKPVLLMADLGPSRGTLLQQQIARIEEVISAVSSVQTLLILDEHDWQINIPVRVARISAAGGVTAGPRQWPRLPFNHPLFIMFTSGTTGPPKGLVHGAGGTLLEHIKEHRLHCDLRRPDKLYFQTTAGWMMWNWQLTALASGVEIVLYDGPIASADCLWRAVAEHRVTVFGTSPAYLQMGERSASPVAEGLDLSSLRAMLSTGSILSRRLQDWVTRSVKPVPIQSISGGTDIIGCFVLGNPNIPLYSAECQCRSLGLDVRALDGNGRESRGIGELVCANPFPSRPLGMLQDPEGLRFHKSYFSQNAGYWTHGDLIEITAEGSIRIHGRSDGVLNVRGVRIGPAEIVRILEKFDELSDAMAGEQSAKVATGDSRLVLLVVLKEGYRLDEPLRNRMRRALSQQGSPAHVPEAILQVNELPTTFSGKVSQRSATDALNGKVALNTEALRNPASLQPLLEFSSQQPDEERITAASDVVAHSINLSEMIAIWERVLNARALSPHDDFFELGGDSLTALRLIAEIERQSGHPVPLTALIARPTIAQILSVANGEDVVAATIVVPLRGGSGENPLFIVHGYGGSVMELRQLAQLVTAEVPIYGIQASGLAGGVVHDSVEEMGRSYLSAIKEIQPRGPYRIAGYSAGGLVAYEMAKTLRTEGETISFLGFIDTVCHEKFWDSRAWREYLVRRTLHHVRVLRDLKISEAPTRLLEVAMRLLRRLARVPLGKGPPNLETLPETVRAVRRASFSAFASYRPNKSDLPVTLMRSDLASSSQCDPVLIWRNLTNQLTIHDVSGNHASMLRSPNVAVLADALSASLKSAALQKDTPVAHATDPKSSFQAIVNVVVPRAVE